MIKALSFFTLLLTGLPGSGQGKTDDPKRDAAFYLATKKWFAAWELVSTQYFKVRKVKPVEFVFFDDQYVYSTSVNTTKKGHPVKGNDLMNLKLRWKRELHHDSLILPDHSVVPVNVMSFAAEIPGENKSFFVMPLPAFWEQAAVTSKELGLDNLITGVFIHEFSHSQQMQNFGKQMSTFEKETNFGIEFSDDIVQHLFSKDSSYLKRYKKEINFWYDLIKTKSLTKAAVQQGLSLMKDRQDQYFKGNYNQLTEIDNFFLTMEGLGQYSMYLWLIDPKGGNIKSEMAIEGVRRGGKWWSQDQGLALFLILEKFSTPGHWAKEMFGDKTVSVIALLNQLH